MDIFSNFSKNGSVVAEIGRIEGGSPPVRRQRASTAKARWEVVDIEGISIGNPMGILPG